jgi:Cu/Ag efflux pump CusA
MIFFFVAAWLAYKRAKENGRNGIVWALITSVSFIAAQLITGMAIGLAIFAATGFDGTGDEIIDRFAIVINIAGIVVSILVVWLILRYLSKVPEDGSFTPPPAPPTFEG